MVLGKKQKRKKTGLFKESLIKNDLQSCMQVIGKGQGNTTFGLKRWRGEMIVGMQRSF